MKGPDRAGRASTRGYTSPGRGARGRPCPKCGARPGWRCVKVQGGIEKPMVKTHKGR